MTDMWEMARRENIAAREHWGQPYAPFEMVAPPNIDHKMVPRVLSCLREGLGVEDMEANGTCTAGEARQVVSWMRKSGSLAKFYAQKGADT